MKRIMITLSDDEFGKLASLARDTLRTPQEQARHLLQSILFGDGVVSMLDDLTKLAEVIADLQSRLNTMTSKHALQVDATDDLRQRVAALEEAQRMREGEL